MNSFTLNKGHNLIIDGSPIKKIIDTASSDSILIHPSSIKNIKVKLLVNEGDEVKIGSPLFYNKLDDKVLFVSTCSGIIEKIVFGEKRIVEGIQIKNNKEDNFKTLNYEINKDNLLKSGLWTYLRQKPYSKIPHSSIVPKSIFISTIPTEPFALDNNFLFNNFNYIQKGIDAIKTVFDCKLNMIMDINSPYEQLNNIESYTFNRLHPSGNVGIQIHHIDPICDSSDTRLYLSIQDLNRIGEFFTTGKYPCYKYISVGGNGALNQAIYKMRIGTKISNFLKITNDENLRVISGDILSGKETCHNCALNYHDEILSIITTNKNKEFLGWLMPGLKKYSLTKTFLSKLISNRKSILTTKKNGSLRTIISMGNWEKVLPMYIFPEYLVKSILASDIDMMEKLGIYECSPEDFALCSFVCQSKIEVSKIIEEGLDIMEKEE